MRRMSEVNIDIDNHPVSVKRTYESEPSNTASNNMNRCRIKADEGRTEYFYVELLMVEKAKCTNETEQAVVEDRIN